MSDVDVTLVRENEDGSAVFTFELAIEQQQALLRYGIIAALKAGIEEAKQYHPDYKEQNEDTSNT